MTNESKPELTQFVYLLGKIETDAGSRLHCSSGQKEACVVQCQVSSSSVLFLKFIEQRLIIDCAFLVSQLPPQVGSRISQLILCPGLQITPTTRDFFMVNNSIITLTYLMCQLVTFYYMLYSIYMSYRQKLKTY